MSFDTNELRQFLHIPYDELPQECWIDDASHLIEKAADEIDRLTAENEVLQKRMEFFREGRDAEQELRCKQVDYLRKALQFVVNQIEGDYTKEEIERHTIFRVICEEVHEALKGVE